MKDDEIPFSVPRIAGRESAFIEEALQSKSVAGDGPFTKRCQEWLEQRIESPKALLTHSCTGALEMGAILAGIEPGDEVIMPSFTFVSTANAVVLRGGVPLFVDIREDTLNLDESLVADAITERTRAVIAVHYGGVGCEMDRLMELGAKSGIFIMEDAAQALLASYKGKPLGGIGDLGAVSFHETKNIISGEGGAFLARDEEIGLRAEIVREKGTDRSQFRRGQIDKYTWRDVGSSYLPSEVIAAFLWAQLELADDITAQRKQAWSYYHESLAEGESQGLLRRPIVPEWCQHNAHLYYVLLPEEIDRTSVLDSLRQDGIGATFHYVPLHSAPAGQRFARVFGNLEVTEKQSRRLIRLPLWPGLSQAQQDRVLDRLRSAIMRSSS